MSVPPWERRKRRCGNCQHWERPGDPVEMGRCEATIDYGSFALSPKIYVFALGQYIREPLQTSQYFYCCQYLRATPPPAGA